MILIIVEHDSFVYGGQNDDHEQEAGTYVLSIPAFRWVMASSRGPLRSYHQCTAAGNRQMIVVGGQGHLDLEDPKTGLIEDGSKWGLDVFDMHDLVWKDSYDPEAGSYETPTMIKNWYTEGYGRFHPSTHRSVGLLILRF